MTYSVKEIFYTLQGEGANAGRAAVFCRFSGCNLWSGREQHRTTAVCRFCDTDFVGTSGPRGGKFGTAEDLANAILEVWKGTTDSTANRFVVCTGGEPLLQLDSELVRILHEDGFKVAVESNGTRVAPPDVDWICVSPKAGAELVQRSGDELKLAYPQAGAEPRRFDKLDFEHRFLQPIDGRNLHRNTELAIAYCYRYPRWRLSIQTHKLLGLP